MIRVMFIEYRHKFMKYKHDLLNFLLILLSTRILKNSCSDADYVIHIAEFSSVCLCILLSSLCLILYVSNTKYLMVFQSMSILLYLDNLET